MLKPDFFIIIRTNSSLGMVGFDKANSVKNILQTAQYPELSDSPVSSIVFFTYPSIACNPNFEGHTLLDFSKITGTGNLSIDNSLFNILIK